MAQLLAEKMTKAESANIPEEKVAFENQAVDLILRIWRQRYQLPYGVGPFGKLENAIAALSAMEAQKANPFSRTWGNYREQTPWDSFDAAVDELHSRVRPLAVLTPLIAEMGEHPLEWEAKNQHFLEEFETDAVTLLQEWMLLLGDGSGIPVTGEPSPVSVAEKTRAAVSKIEHAVSDMNVAFEALKTQITKDLD